MYSEKVATEDIATWLSFHCTVLRSIELRDEDGIRWDQLGPIRGHVFYAGQPKTCRKCGCLSHLAVSCSATFCRNCKSTSHNTNDCDQPMKCNLCGSDTHTFRRCPQSYANKARQSNVGWGWYLDGGDGGRGDG
uniref:CCHC-type domain-containing protein n=1 Tax=Stegastes partitus TaxID=144197 RepID=A0A3B5AF18_9TELE